MSVTGRQTIPGQQSSPQIVVRRPSFAGKYKISVYPVGQESLTGENHDGKMALIRVCGQGRNGG